MKATIGLPKNRATPERSASVTTMCAVPEVEEKASRKGEATANSGAATMIRIRCWIMWSQKSSPS